MKNKLIPYNPILKRYARELRKNSTIPEIILWKHLKKKALGVEFHRQVPLLDYIVDFYCHEIRLVIEIDGSIHDQTFEYDSKRTKRLSNYGIQIIRFSNQEIKQEMFSVLLSIEQVIQKLR
ncbi:DUF559 domain-containing protein [Zeaxanthinibacter sp. PT1]|uniref:endonuclease domain-containing protein n=1 Tax=Zeaxanthinibacter TaxID=561554 RepID=UPI002349A623|nr:DUF559 domain-containing protein [Zeaxanthinibacter sp. PT1]MDC6350489.1 DUF559 domain-containing protein [Zeaxanthinibacter sp. PT1]